MIQVSVFIASSNELAQERTILGDLSYRIGKLYADEGYELRLLEWEDFDAAYNGVRKQDEYNEVIRTADLFIGMFWRRAGGFTLEECGVAREAGIKSHYFIKSGNDSSPELDSFISTLDDKPERFSGNDELKLLFVKALLKKFPLERYELVEDNGTVRLGPIKIAKVCAQ